VDLEGVAAVLAQECLGDLAAGRVVGAHEQHPDRAIGDDRPPAHAAGSEDRHLEVQELALEAVQVGSLPGDRLALPGQQGDQVTVDRTLVQALSREAAGALRSEAEPPERDNEAKAGEIRLAVDAVAILVAGRLREDALLLVPAHRRGRNPGAAR
jgi:hypothetical protein